MWQAYIDIKQGFTEKYFQYALALQAYNIFNSAKTSLGMKFTLLFIQSLPSTKSQMKHETGFKYKTITNHLR